MPYLIGAQRMSADGTLGESVALDPRLRHGKYGFRPFDGLTVGHQDLTVSPDGRFVTVSMNDPRVWELETGRVVRRSRNHERHAAILWTATKGLTLIGEEGTVFEWGAKAARPTVRPRPVGIGWPTIAARSGGSRSAPRDQRRSASSRSLDVAPGSVPFSLPAPPGVLLSGGHFALSADGSRLALADEGGGGMAGSAIVWDLGRRAGSCGPSPSPVAIARRSPSTRAARRWRSATRGKLPPLARGDRGRHRRADHRSPLGDRVQPRQRQPPSRSGCGDPRLFRVWGKDATPLVSTVPPCICNDLAVTRDGRRAALLGSDEAVIVDAMTGLVTSTVKMPPAFARAGFSSPSGETSSRSRSRTPATSSSTG